MKITASLVTLLLAATLALPTMAQQASVSEQVKGLSRSTAWTLVDEVPIDFVTHHTQGMLKIGDAFYVSSVEITKPTERYETPRDGYDRDTGEGRGHLFKFDAQGKLLGSIELGEGSMYHPGGIDFDGEYIWVPVAEYRPNSAAIVYRVDPDTMEAEEMFRFRDHLGGIVHDTEAGTLNAVTWGSRRFYSWSDEALADIEFEQKVPLDQAAINTSSYVDYQDCHYIGGSEMLCAGIASYSRGDDTPAFGLGGLEIVSLADGRPIHQLPVALWSPAGRPMLQNPFFVEATDTGVRAYFMPDDDKSTLFVYEAEAQ